MTARSGSRIAPHISSGIGRKSSGSCWSGPEDRAAATPSAEHRLRRSARAGRPSRRERPTTSMPSGETSSTDAALEASTRHRRRPERRAERHREDRPPTEHDPDAPPSEGGDHQDSHRCSRRPAAGPAPAYRRAQHGDQRRPRRRRSRRRAPRPRPSVAAAQHGARARDRDEQRDEEARAPARRGLLARNATARPAAGHQAASAGAVRGSGRRTEPEHDAQHQQQSSDSSQQRSSRAGSSALRLDLLAAALILARARRRRGADPHGIFTDARDPSGDARHADGAVCPTVIEFTSNRPPHVHGCPT